MSHTLDFESLSGPVSFTLYVSSIANKNSQVIAEQQILDKRYTTLQFMGAKSLVKTIQFYFEDATGSMTNLVNLVNGGFLSRYTDDTGASGSFVITEFSHSRVQALNKTNPWYQCSMTMTHIPVSGSLYYQWESSGIG